MDTNNQSEQDHYTVVMEKRQKVEQQLLDRLSEASSTGNLEHACMAEGWARAYATFHATVYPPAREVQSDAPVS